MAEATSGAQAAYKTTGKTIAEYSLSKTWEQAMNYSRENPGKSTLIAFGVGVGVGLLMTNGYTMRRRSERIAPPLMNAISEIASALFR